MEYRYVGRESQIDGGLKFLGKSPTCGSTDKGTKDVIGVEDCTNVQLRSHVCMYTLHALCLCMYV